MLDRKSGEFLCAVTEACAQTERAVLVHAAGMRIGLRAVTAARLAADLAEAGMLTLLRYGYALPTDKGLAACAYIRQRRTVVRAFLSVLTGREDTAEECRRIEYLLEEDTAAGMQKFLAEQTGGAQIRWEKGHTEEKTCIHMP